MEAWEIAGIVALAGIAAFIQAISGFGFSLFVVPFLAVLVGAKEAVVLSNLLSTGMTAFQSFNLRSGIERRTVSILLVGSYLGMPLGLAILLIVDPSVLTAIIAIAVATFTLLLMRGLRLHDGGTPGDLATGFTSGVLNTSTSMSGPPVVIYLQGKGLSPLAFRSTITAFFLFNSIGALGLLALSGQISVDLLVAAALSAPAVVAGALAGNRVFPRINERYFRRIVYAILLVSAAVAFANAILG